MSRYTENLSLISIGAAFASILTGIFGSVFLSAIDSTMGYVFFGAGFILFIAFLVIGVTILFTGQPDSHKDDNLEKNNKGV